MQNSFLNDHELEQLNFNSYGQNVLISRFARFYNAESMDIGDNIRIDDFCILSGKIQLHNHIHISAFSALYGKFGIEMNDYSGLSPRCSIFSATDDFSGDYLINSMVDEKYTNVTGGKVSIGKYCQIGASCVILPNVTINEGAVVGAVSLINRDLESWNIYAGSPVKLIKERRRNLLGFLSQ